ncbi:protein kinase, partial [bacterium]|nr:protein kinase [candidate division CSSED10-310 bacterium]
MRYLGGRYRVISLLGGGGMGTVFKVRDLATGCEIALKRLKPEFVGSEENVRLLEIEFKHMSTFSHRHLVRVYDFHSDEEIGAYFTMEFVDGVTIEEYLKPLDQESLYKVALQVCQALDYVHARGFIHGDVKIGNILIAANGDALPQVKLLDFGLVRGSGVDKAGLWGTSHTMAPELIRGGAADGRSDLYAFGVVLYRIVTGRFPFSNGDNLSILRQHLTTTPVQPSTFAADLDPDLDRVILRLLEKNPARRYYSAADLAEVFAGKAQISQGVSAQVARLNSPAHIGRGAELTALVDDYRQVQRGSGRVVMVAGEAGIGKSRLLRELKTTIQLSGGRCLMVSCRDVSGTAFAVLRHLYLMAGGRLEEWPEFPVEACEENRLRREDHLHQLVDLLGLVSAAGQLVMIIEDLQEGDDGTAAMVTHCARVLGESGIKLLLVVSSRTCEPGGLASDPEQFAAGAASIIRLKGLDEGDYVLLLSDILGQKDLPAEFAECLFSETGGNPADTIELLQLLVETGELVRQGNRWVTPGGHGSWSRHIVHLGHAAQARVAALPIEEQEVLRLAAVLGERFSSETLITYSGLSAGVVRSLLLRLVRSGILRREDVSFSFARVSTKQAIYDGLPVDEKVELHERALAMYCHECDDDHDILSCADHICRLIDLGDCENCPDTLAQLLEANQVALRNLQYGAARRYLDHAVTMIPGKVTETTDVELVYRVRIARLRLALNIGDCTMVDADLAALDEMSLLLEPRLRVELFSLRAALAIAAGAVDEAERWCQQARRLLCKYQDPATDAAILLQMGEILKIRGTIKQAQNLYRTAHEIYDSLGDHLHTAECEINIGRICMWTGEQEKAIGYLERARHSYARMKEPVGECRALVNLGVAYSHLNQAGKALEFYRAALAMSRRIGNRRLEGAALLNAGNICTQTGEYESAASYFQESLELHRRVDQRLALIMTIINIGYLKALMGDFNSARQCLQSAAEMAAKEKFKRENSLAKLYLGGVAFFTSNIEEAFLLFQEALELQEQMEDMLGAAEVHNWLSRIYRSAG